MPKFGRSKSCDTDAVLYPCDVHRIVWPYARGCLTPPVYHQWPLPCRTFFPVTDRCSRHDSSGHACSPCVVLIIVVEFVYHLVSIFLASRYIRRSFSLVPPWLVTSNDRVCNFVVTSAFTVFRRLAHHLFTAICSM